MELEAGKSYRDGEGHVVKITSKVDYGTYPFRGQHPHGEVSYMPNGGYMEDQPGHTGNLIEEVCTTPVGDSWTPPAEPVCLEPTDKAAIDAAFPPDDEHGEIDLFDILRVLTKQLNELTPQERDAALSFLCVHFECGGAS